MKAKNGQIVAKRRGFIDNDPLPDRPPEDDIAHAMLYFEAMASFVKGTTDLKPALDRVQRLLDPAAWTLLLNTFAIRQVPMPAEMLKLLTDKIAADPTAVELLDGGYLCSMAYGLGCVARDAPSDGVKAAMAVIAARAGALGTLTESEARNLKYGLAVAGVPLPAGLKVVPDPELVLEAA